MVINTSAVGSTSVGISDVPFAYSLIGLLLIIYLEKPATDTLLIVGLGGSVLGTFLLITHPIQRLLVAIFLLINRRDIFPYRPGPNWNKLYTIHRPFVVKALLMASIRFERDRIVAIFYFIIILGLVLIGVVGGSIGRAFEIQNQDLVLPSAVVVLIAVSIIFVLFASESKKFRSRVAIAAVYLKEVGTHSNFTVKMDNFLDQIGRAIEVNDWITAREWVEMMLMYLLAQEGDPPRSFVLDEKRDKDSH